MWLWVNGIFWFGILPIVGFWPGQAIAGGWGAFAVVAGLVGGFITQPILHRHLDESLYREAGYVGWSDPGTGTGVGGGPDAS